jgi:hypothetical protein
LSWNEPLSKILFVQMHEQGLKSNCASFCCEINPPSVTLYPDLHPRRWIPSLNLCKHCLKELGLSPA